MKKILAVVLLLSGLGRAQDLPKFDVATPSRQQVLKMRYSGLATWADQHAGAMNEVEADFLAGWYAKMRNQANVPLLQGKPGLVQAMKDLRAWNNDYYDALYLYQGGGTMYSHAASRSVASLADVEADAASAWAKAPGKTPAGRPFAQVHPDYTKVDQDQARLRKAVAAENASFGKALASLKKLPGGAREVLGRYLAELSEAKWGEN